MARRAMAGQRLDEKKLYWLHLGRYLMSGVDEVVRIFEVSPEPIQDVPLPDTPEVLRIYEKDLPRPVSWLGRVRALFAAAGSTAPPPRPVLKASAAVPGVQGAERLGRHLQALYERREKLTIANEDTRVLDAEILDVRRLLRKGPQLQPGEFLLDGRYRLREPLGQGGFATVWKAYDRKLQRLVAAKVLHGQHADERTRRERFFPGSRKMAELVHPHIVRVLEKELDDDGWLFFVMELVPGGDFGRAVLDGKMSVEERLRIVCTTGETLEFAHRQGVVHRDVKPANILLDADGQPKLTDFDLVRAEDSTGFTQTRAMLGTLNYAAPEVLEDPKNARPAADVYSLASTAVFALLGGLPGGYYRDPAKVIAGLDVASALAEVLTRGASVDLKERYASASAFVSALREAASAPPAPPPKPGPPGGKVAGKRLKVPATSGASGTAFGPGVASQDLIDKMFEADALGAGLVERVFLDVLAQVDGQVQLEPGAVELAALSF